MSMEYMDTQSRDGFEILFAKFLVIRIHTKLFLDILR